MAFVSQILWISSLEKNSETTDKYFTLILHSRISVILVVMLFVDWMTRWCHLTEHSLFRKGFQGDQISSKIFVSLGKDILMNFCQFLQPTLREKCPYSLFGVFLVTTFSRSDLIRRDTRYLSVFSQNAGKYGPEKLQIQTLFTQCCCLTTIISQSEKEYFIILDMFNYFLCNSTLWLSEIS